MQYFALAVDDDQQTLFFIKQVLESTGLEVLQAPDGLQAIDILKSVTPSVIYLDMLLPQISGIEVLDFILKTPRLSGTYVVVVSAHNHFPPSEQLTRVDTYLVKPVRPKEIRDAALFAIERQAAG